MVLVLEVVGQEISLGIALRGTAETAGHGVPMVIAVAQVMEALLVLQPNQS
jgi:hypothetical protein